MHLLRFAVPLLSLHHPKSALAVLALLALASVFGHAGERPRLSLDEIAERYVRLALAAGVHDPDFVDAYYGPPAWRAEAEKRQQSVEDVRREAKALADDVAARPAPSDEMTRLRQDYLHKQLVALGARLDVRAGRKLTFDEESRLLYDAVAPTHDEPEFRAVMNELDALLPPGPGTLLERYSAFRSGFVIPREKLDRVFRAAIEEGRRRTLAHVELPPEESFEIEYVTGKPWSGYNWYKGSYHSVIQVNTDVPVGIDRAIDLACHEGYPGHHVYNVLLEQRLVHGRGWMEFTVYPLFSPQSLIAEGTANYGIEVAFPGNERLVFEREVLYPLAGLDPAKADAFARVQLALEKLSYVGNEAARRYLEGRMDAAATTRWLEAYALMAPDRAQQRLRFFDQYRSYVINYNLGQDLVRRHVQVHGGTAEAPARRWDEFVKLLASPRLPGGLS